MDPALTPPTEAIASKEDSPSREPFSGFSISDQPLAGAMAADPENGASAELTAAKGNEPLYLLPRDPHSVVAYWDLDWSIAFGEPAPREREVMLKISKTGEAEVKSVAVQPRAGSYLIEELEADNTYSATLGYYDSSTEWVPLAVSAPVATPGAKLADLADGDFATVPFHLSFQRMLELLRVPKRESRSLTAMLNGLRARDEPGSPQEMRGGQAELVTAVRDAAVQDPPPTGAASIAELWTPELMNHVLGGLAGGSSSQNGFSGSSRAA
ncbi:MAG: DUF4912 domain-containing protein [Verrucomicrobiota bacterium]|nr:DUF4912 domain-containing protein [Verrucomicrobiota bacterium]